jgi:hypothetical protein
MISNYGAFLSFFHVTLGGHRGNTARIRARWRRPMAASEAMKSLYWEMSVALYQRTSATIEQDHDRDAFIPNFN